MTDHPLTDHPITPPFELVEKWCEEASHTLGHRDVGFAHDHFIASKAAQWGADQEQCAEQKSTCPPIGIEPEFIWKEKRLYDLVQTVSRYIDSRAVEPKPEWFSEIHKLIGDLQTNTSRLDNYNNRRTTDDDS